MIGVLIYLGSLEKSYGGVYQYSLSILSTLSKSRFKSFKFYIYSTNPDEEIIAFVELHDNFFLLNQNKSYEWRRQAVYYGNRIIGLTNWISFQLLRIPQIKQSTWLESIVSTLNIKIVHCPFEKILNASFESQIVTIHDLQELHFPEFFTPAERVSRAVNKLNCVNNAKVVLCSFVHVKNDIIKYFPSTYNKVQVCPLPITSQWIYNYSSRPFDIQSYLPSCKRYILYPAATWPHKNHLNLLKSFKEIIKKDSEIGLVCTGRVTEHYNTVLKPLIFKNSLENNVVFRDVVSHQELLDLYKKCDAVVIPSLYEAGSFPLIESILLGVPVICSNVTSLPETINNSNFIFDPNDLNEMTKKMVK